MPSPHPVSSFSRRGGPTRKRGAHAAFTLIEVMMAFTMLIAGICGGLLTLQSGFKAVDTARCSTLAAQIMQSQIEKLRLKPWTELTVVANQPVTVSDLVPSTAADVAGRFNLTQTIQPDAGRAGMMNIALTVTWVGVGNIAHTRSFVTRYAQNGLNDFYVPSPSS